MVAVAAGVFVSSLRSNGGSVPPSAGPMPAACPATSTRVKPGSADPRGLGGHLVPGHPDQALLCRYFPRLGLSAPGVPHATRYGTARLDGPRHYGSPRN